MHTANFLHRDIAPDNIIIRTDSTPVLLDFGSARRAVAEMSRSLTGIVKAGYSPHEQYSSDSRLQGPWSDLYALGGTFYRAVTGKPPEEATLRFDEDHMTKAADGAKGKYRRDFLSAIDACLKVRHSERPRSVAQLRPMLLGRKSQPKGTERLVEPTFKLPSKPASTPDRPASIRQMAKRWPAIAAAIAVVAGAYGGYEFRQWNAAQSGKTSAERERSLSEAESVRKAAAEAAARQQAALDADKRQREKEAADARQQQIELAEARRRKEQADAAEADARRKADATAEAKRKEEQRIAALEEVRRKEDDARRKADADTEEKRRIALEEARRRVDEARRRDEADQAIRKSDAEAKRKEEQRIAALEASRRSEEKRKEDDRLRLAAIPNDADRAAFVRRIQEVLKKSNCYNGAVNGRSNDAQEGLNKFVDSAGKRGKAKPGRIELAKASVGDFESWLKDADAIKDSLCEKPKPVAAAKPEQPAKPRPQYTQPQPRPYAPRPSSGGGMGPIQGIQ